MNINGDMNNINYLHDIIVNIINISRQTLCKAIMGPYLQGGGDGFRWGGLLYLIPSSQLRFIFQLLSLGGKW